MHLIPVEGLPLAGALAVLLCTLSSAAALGLLAGQQQQHEVQAAAGPLVILLGQQQPHRRKAIQKQQHLPAEAAPLFPTDMSQWNYTDATIVGGLQQRLWSTEDLEAAVSVHGRQDGAMRQLLGRLQGGHPIVVLALGTSVTRRGGCFHRDRCVRIGMCECVCVCECVWPRISVWGRGHKSLHAGLLAGYY